MMFGDVRNRHSTYEKESENVRTLKRTYIGLTKEIAGVLANDDSIVR